MQERKRPEKNKALPELHSSVTEILVANGRAFQPFIRTFRYTGENISKANLGTLLGVFEIDDQSEDSAYIVNFLASVAKKEYFNNPRRGAIESFEAALHKINLALAELVKHGNVTWLGKFHGALGVLEKNNLHFSVSGHAIILLLRNGTIADISDGLASDESHIHPIKTFVEVSSGRLNTGDQVLVSTPELPALFGLEELNKHATRLGNERFTQFLKTALINELDMAGLLVADVSESVPSDETAAPEKKAPKSKPIRVNNVFSQSAFTPKSPDELPSVSEILVAQQEEKEDEYIDSKTGHIYVQGEATETSDRHPFLEGLLATLQEFPRTITILFRFLNKHLRRSKKQSVIFIENINEESRALGKKIARSVRRQGRKYHDAQEKRALEKKERENVLVQTTPPTPILPANTETKKAVSVVSDIPQPNIPMPQEYSLPHPEIKESSTIPITAPDSQLPHFLKEKLAQFYQKKETLKQSSPKFETARTETLSVLSKVFTQVKLLVLKGAHLGRKTYQRLSYFLRQRFAQIPATHTTKSGSQQIIERIVLLVRKYVSFRLLLITSAVLFVGISGAVWYFFTPTDLPQETTAPTLSENPLTTPGNQTAPPASGELSLLLTDIPGPIIASVILDDQVYAVTEKSIIAVNENKSFPLPGGSRAQFATAMDDLRLIFVYTENNHLYAFSPITKSFVENTLPLDSSVVVSGIDTYLTYLYVLDSTSDQVYRFPRADGGFGAGTPWLKESAAIENTAQLTVNETLFIGLDQAIIKGFFRGRNSTTFEIPNGGLSINDLYTHPGLANVYGLDATHKRILIWNQDGRLVKEISHDKLSEGITLSANEKQGEFFISTSNSLLSYKLR